MKDLKSNNMAKKKDTRTEAEKVEDTATAFERPLDRMLENADLAMRLLNKFSGGKLKEKYDKKQDKEREADGK